MRRDFRKKKKQNDNIIMYSVAGALVLITIVFALIMYGNTLNSNVKNSQLSSDQIASILGNETDSESASSDIGKSVEEQEKEDITETKTEISNEENNSNVNTTNTTEDLNSTYQQTSTITTTTNTNTDNVSNQVVQSTNANTSETIKKKELNFQMPVEGEIVREFAQDNLVYSETLQEWVTHDGIDIKADKTTVVQAAEAGNVKSIKNDPRYGLTIIIEHEDGFQTIYANLLSTEFVTEGEKVEKGQSIGTVGNTAAFESVDEPHLHFEMIKDSVKVDPNIYMK